MAKRYANVLRQSMVFRVSVFKEQDTGKSSNKQPLYNAEEIANAFSPPVICLFPSQEAP